MRHGELVSPVDPPMRCWSSPQVWLPGEVTGDKEPRSSTFFWHLGPQEGFSELPLCGPCFTRPVFISRSHHHVHLQQNSTSALDSSGGSDSVELTEKGTTHGEKVVPSRVLRSLGSRCHITRLDLTSLAWHATLFQVTMSLSASVSSPVKLKVKDRASCL